MITTGKILLLAAVAAATWGVVRWTRRRQAAVDRRPPPRRVENLEACPTCAAYVAPASSAAACPRPDCPYRPGHS